MRTSVQKEQLSGDRSWFVIKEICVWHRLDWLEGNLIIRERKKSLGENEYFIDNHIWIQNSVQQNKSRVHKIKAESTKYKIPPNSGFGVVWHHSFLGHRRHADTWSSRFRLNYSHRYPAMNFQLLSLFWDNLSIDCLKKRESSWIYSYQMCFVSRFHQQKQKYFLGGGSIKLRKCFTTLLAITRLLDFEVTTLPYPTRSWKTTTRWSLSTAATSQRRTVETPAEAPPQRSQVLCFHKLFTGLRIQELSRVWIWKVNSMRIDWESSEDLGRITFSLELFTNPGATQLKNGYWSSTGGSIHRTIHNTNLVLSLIHIWRCRR